MDNKSEKKMTVDKERTGFERTLREHRDSVTNCINVKSSVRL